MHAVLYQNLLSIVYDLYLYYFTIGSKHNKHFTYFVVTLVAEDLLNLFLLDNTHDRLQREMYVVMTKKFHSVRVVIITYNVILNSNGLGT